MERSPFMMLGVLRLTIVLGLTAPGIALANECVVHDAVECHIGGAGFPGQCCEERIKGLDLWSGYCYEKSVPYSRSIVPRAHGNACRQSPCRSGCPSPSEIPVSPESNSERHPHQLPQPKPSPEPDPSKLKDEATDAHRSKPIAIERDESESVRSSICD